MLQSEKFQDVDFGRCPRVYCEGQPVLPVGQSDLPRKATVCVFCPKCKDIYYPRSSRQGSEWRWSLRLALHPTYTVLLL